MENKKTKFPVIGTIIAVVLSALITFFTTNDVFSATKNPIEAYRVYLKGESLGLIESDEELYDYINEMQQSLKEEYNVSNVYIPNDINVVKDITY